MREDEPVDSALTRSVCASTIRAVTCPHHPDADLLAAGREVEALAVEIEALQALWPKGETAVRRTEIGRSLDGAYDRLAELYGTITNTDAHTLVGAAVNLRRGLLLMNAATPGDSDELKTAKRLLSAALVFLEAHHCRVLTPKAGDEASSQTARPP